MITIQTTGHGAKSFSLTSSSGGAFGTSGSLSSHSGGIGERSFQGTNDDKQYRAREEKTERLNTLQEERNSR